MLALGFMTSCGDDDGPVTPGAPTIEISTDDGENEEEFSGYVGDSVVLNINVDAAGGFNTLRIYRQEDGVKGTAIQTYSKVSGTTVTSFDTTFTYKIQEEDVDNAIFLVFEAVDDTEDGVPSTLEYEIIAQEDPTINYTAKLLYAPTGDLNSETFFSTNNGETYTMNEVLGTSEAVSAQIDFGYYYRNNDKHSISSPAAYPTDIVGYNLEQWDVKNATLIRRTDVTATQFLERGNDVDFINEAYENGTSGENEGRATALVEGEILAFELVSSKANKKGLIKVVDIVGTTGSTDHVEIDVIVVD